MNPFHMKYGGVIGYMNNGQAVVQTGQAVWYWSLGDVVVEEANHNCGPDCACWEHAKQLRGEITEMKVRSA
jgi:hypothetical protein